MKKILLALMLLPSVALAQTSVYQGPTPIAKLSTTPSAGNTSNGIAVDQFLNQKVVVYGGAALATPVAAEITPSAQSIMLPTSVPTLFPVTPNALINTDALKAVRIDNSFNIDMICTYGAAAATPLPFTVRAGTQNFENFAEKGIKMSSGVSCTRDANATPSAGTLKVWGYK